MRGWLSPLPECIGGAILYDETIRRKKKNGISSRACIEANAQALARYAVLCQEVGLVPIALKNHEGVDEG